MTDQRFGALTPHIELLQKGGYAIHSYAGNYQHVSMVKAGLFADVTTEGTELSFVFGGFCKATTGKFQNSHPNFNVFELKMVRAKEALGARGLG